MKILKWIFIVLVVVAIGGCFAMRMASESKPAVNQTPEADQLADKMLVALNKPAWDTLQFLQWEFMQGHKYVWDKQNNKVVVRWKANQVNLNLDDQSGKAYVKGEEVTGEKADKLRGKAWSYWCNDSFWMFAPYKIYDPGTSRSIVKVQGKEALMVSYDSGGVTPGDSYLWLLDDNYVPNAFKMWVKIIPIGGMKSTWENWKDLPSGAKVATKHGSPAMGFEMKDVKEGNSWADFGLETPVF